MFPSDTHVDKPLATFTNDYVEGVLSNAERSAFEEYLSMDEEWASFVKKSEKGKRALQHTYRVKAADDFEQKLARRIKGEQSSPVSSAAENRA